MKTVLVANRGEIAVRVIRACHDMGLKTVAVYSTADHEALHVLHADVAVCIGEASAGNSYLKIANILSACEITDADAIHPGYGFLSENANFASICESCGLTFIGPSPDAIAHLGDKVQAKNIARRAKCPVIPGSEDVIEDCREALSLVKKIGFPVYIKATSGGGGKGIRVVDREDDFAKNFAAASAEAEANFGNSHVYIEKVIENPRHIEVQVLGDQHGNYISLGERDCSIQRRRQKLIEETPSPVLSVKLRDKICAAAVAIAKEARYFSAGTVEFLLDEKNNFYFMEMNTRIQVEHTVTEMATGIDLIVEQLRIAQGEKLRISQKDVVATGHSMQFRINAEDPKRGFTPYPGCVEYYLPPGGPNVRIDSACYSGYKIPSNYDSMIAKLIVHGTDREHAFSIAKRALREFHIGGVKTTIPFHLYMLEDENFIEGNYDLDYIDNLVAQGCSF
jgi:acetyl-CoA carboxylase, biotin carboxylase subunit